MPLAPRRPAPPVPKPAVPQLDTSVFAGLGAQREAEGTVGRTTRRLFGSGAAAIKAPTSVPGNLSAALAAVAKVSPKAQQAYDHAYKSARNGGAGETAAKTAGDVARAQLWEDAGVPEELRPMRANVRGAQLRRNEESQLDRRVLADHARQELRAAKTASAITPAQVAKLGLGGATHTPVAAPKLPDGTALETVLGITGAVGTVGGKGTQNVGKPAGLNVNIGSMAGAAGGSLTEAAGTIGGIASIAAAVEARGKGGAIGKQATTDLGQAVLGTARSATSTAKNLVSIVDRAQNLQAAASAPVTALGSVATTMGGATGVVGAVGSAVTAGQQGTKARKLGALHKDIEHDLALADVVSGSGATLKNKAAVSTAKVVGSSLGAAGGFTGGPVTPWGLGLGVAGSVVSGTAAAVDATADAHNAGVANEGLDVARYGGGASGADAAKQVLRRSPAHQAETLLLRAKDGDAAAKKALSVYGIGDDDLKGDWDKLVALMAKQQGRSAKTETFGQQASSTAAGLGAKFSEGGGVANWSDRRDIRWRTAQAKNLMAYGGRSDRTERTEKAKGFFTLGQDANRQRKGLLAMFQANRAQFVAKGFSGEKLRQIEQLLQSGAMREAMAAEDQGWDAMVGTGRARSGAVSGR